MGRLIMLLGAHFWLAGTIAAAGTGGVVHGSPVPLREGDRVVLIGSAFVEREAESGYLEAGIARRHPGRAIVVRNLGWTGDTVGGITRGKPNPPTDGFGKLVEHVAALRPTVIVLGYGANESFAGAAGLPGFAAGLDRLMDALSPTGARLVVLTPPRQVNLGPPLPDPAAHNADLERYGDVLLQAAARRGAVAADLGRSDLFAGSPAGVRRMTANGVHLTPAGYRRATALIAEALDPAGPDADADGAIVSIADGRATAEGAGATVTDLAATPTGVRFAARFGTLPALPCPGPSPSPAVAAAGGRQLRVAGLAPGRYVLGVDGRPAVLANADRWRGGVDLPPGAEGDQAEALRRAVVRKDLLHFHRWRPQNETYLFGFRKHEQGRNAAELAAFDPLIAAAEAEIARLSRPAAHAYELTPLPPGDAIPPQIEVIP